MQTGRISIVLAIAISTVACIPSAHARGWHHPDSQDSQASDNQSTPANQNPLKRKLSDQEKFKQQKELKQELKGPYKKWLDEDVRWIITDQERKAFLSLSNDEERDAFIEQFWQRRNPDPDSPDNTYRDEIYRRIAYANEHFAAGKPGWMTDRGMIYIKYGAPDDIESHPSGGIYERPMDEGGGETSTYPFEDWHYRYIDGIGSNVNIEFVDTCMCGDYVMTLDRGAKDALAHVPGAGDTLYEQMGMAKRSQRLDGGLETLGAGPYSSVEQSKEFDRLERFAELQAPPVVKFKDLEAFVTSHKVLNGPIFPFDVQTDFVKVTDDTILVPVTIQIKNRDITFNTKDGVSKGVVNIFGRVSTITDRVVQTFESTVEVEQPSELLPKTMNTEDLYWKALPLRPGRYRLDIAIKDVNNPDHVGVYARGIEVPRYNNAQLAASSLILSDKMYRVPAKDIGTGNFIIGNTFVRPRVSDSPNKPVSFHRNQSLDFWMQVYNLGIGGKTQENAAKITYQIIDATTNKTLLDTSESSQQLGAHLDQVTIEKSLPLASLQPGKYLVKIMVDDSISKQEIAQSAPFTVE
ncbi:MAG TPA: GWxTD domain-containing protein [Acidobacteriaceae bacterium]|nr:GWxTD domain-containing protein [Acidobacteriaceae bacterium]